MAARANAGEMHFNPRSPRGGATFVHKVLFGQPAIFQSTLPTRGSDPRADYMQRANSLFQSTLPTRGSDLFAFLGKLHRLYFNPRSPRGGATEDIQRLRTEGIFQSTLPTRGSDQEAHNVGYVMGISIHAPHEGERRTARQIRLTGDVISIHAPHEGERPPRAQGAGLNF